jgi:hypothetical protein
METIRFIEELSNIEVEEARNETENGWFDWA